ncbi:hypothetical protein [Niveispirillum sp. KHB5.9]
MDGFATLSPKEDQEIAVPNGPVMEAGEWVAVSAGDSAYMVWFPAADRD